MSYSFHVSGTTKDEVRERVAEQLDKVVESQPIHAADRDTHEKAVGDMLDLVEEPGEKYVITCNVNGSCYRYGEIEKLSGAGFGVTLGTAPR